MVDKTMKHPLNTNDLNLPCPISHAIPHVFWVIADTTADDWDWTTSGEGTELLGSALNNLSLAMVYSCDVMRGVRTLEELIRKNPRLYMLDVVVFNLCTLYDLSFDAVASATKKRTLQAVGQRYRLEDVDSASFRIS